MQGSSSYIYSGDYPRRYSPNSRAFSVGNEANPMVSFWPLQRLSAQLAQGSVATVVMFVAAGGAGEIVVGFRAIEILKFS